MAQRECRLKRGERRPLEQAKGRLGTSPEFKEKKHQKGRAMGKGGIEKKYSCLMGGTKEGRRKLAASVTEVNEEKRESLRKASVGNREAVCSPLKKPDSNTLHKRSGWALRRINYKSWGAGTEMVHPGKKK